MITWTPDTVQLSDLRPWERNPKTISKAHAKRLLETWQRLGQFQTLAIGPDGEVYDGHQRLSVLKAAHGENYEVRVLRSSRPLTEEEREQIVILAHVGTTGQFNWDELANWDAAELQEWGLDGETLQDWKTGIGALTELIEAAKPEPAEDAGAQIDRAEELREKWGVESGQLWQLGEHRLICGDCTNARLVGRLLENGQVDVIVADPPYCSGGFQEAGRSAGSIGTLNPQKIVNDRLSTRGYTALLEYALHAVRAGSIYIFTDWRMWSHLYDLSEANGYGVRSMIVWNKESAGMGYGWRSQHELVLFASKDTPKFDLHKSRGNVIEESRTGNKNHATEKPVELIEELLSVSDFCETVYDPFSGSGTTLIACERLGRKCRAVEITPTYCAVAIQRWVDMTGKTPALLEES